MKKYLMFAFAALAFVGCSKSTDVSDANRTPQGDKYANAFAETFGNINPNVNWGFNPMTVYSATTTRSANVNRNEWGTGKGIGGNVAVPKNVNDPSVNSNERTLVYNYFNQKREGAVNQNNVNWSDYFITEVWKGEDSYYDDNQYNWKEVAGQQPVKGSLKDGATKNVTGSNNMNHLQVRYGDGSIDADGKLVGAWEHANDFNKGNHSSEYNTIKGHTYMQNSGTLDFAYHNTTDSKYHNEYIIIPGAEIDPSLAGYYYVGFDFYANGGYVDGNGIMQQKNMRVDRDWVFTDWIVRISPAEFTNAQRVMVEDLIATSLANVDKSDWDFNDAVFDVAFSNDWIASENANKLVAHIKLHAAGGTMALTVGGKEVHSLFGVSTSTMVNTNAAGVGAAADGKAPVTFSVIMGDADYNGSHTADEVPVFIGSTELKAETGKAPQKIVTSTSTRWMKEKKLITTGYEKFADYVNSNSPQDWYNTVSGPDNLY